MIKTVIKDKIDEFIKIMVINLILGLLILTLSSKQTVMAKPDLTTPSNMTILHQKDIGYHFINQTFNAPKPNVDKTEEIYAKPRNYQVWLAIPNQQKNINNIIYILDGNAVIDKIDKELLNKLAKSDNPPALAIIGYQTPLKFDVEARAYDYTPPLINNKKSNDNQKEKVVITAFKENGRERINGGAEEFFQLIETKIKPWVYQQLSYSKQNIPLQESIWGHSYGGLFVLYSLFYHPTSYQNYYSIDPSLWWQQGEIIKQANIQYPFVLKQTQFANNKTLDNYHLTLIFSHSQGKQHLQSQENKINNPSQNILKDNMLTNKTQFAQQLCQNLTNADTLSQPTNWTCDYQHYQQSHGQLFYTGLITMFDDFL